MGSNEELGIIVRIKNVQKAIADSKQIQRAINDVSRAAKNANVDLASTNARASAVFSGLSHAVRSVSSSLAHYSATAGVAGAATVTALVGVGLKTATGLEETNVAIKKLMGDSQAAATDFTDKMQTFAAETPFQFTDVVKNAQQMIAKGFKPDETIAALTAIGNAASGLNAGQAGVDGISRALGQMRMKAKLSAEEVNGQLAEWGVNGWKYLAEAAGKSISQVQEDSAKGMIGGAAASNVILKGLQKEYDGMMLAQSKTLGGRWSTLIDKTKASLYRVDKDGKEGGIMAPLLVMLRDDILPMATKFVEGLVPKAERGMARVVGGLRYLARGYKIGGMEGLVESFGNLIGVGDRLVPVWRHIKTDSANMAAIWQNSLWPAIRNVASILAPFVLGTLAVLERTLQWMADNPDSAKNIFLGVAAVLAGGVVLLGIANVISKVQALIAVVTAAKVALGALGAASVAPAAAGAGGAVAGGAAATGSAAAGAGAAAGGLGLAGGIALGGVAAGYLGHQLYKTYDGITKHFGTYGRFAGGGTSSVAGVSLVGEQGPELVRMPGGSAVTNNKQLMNALSGSNSGRTVNIERGAINISGTDVLNNERVADILLRQIEDRLVRQ